MADQTLSSLPMLLFKNIFLTFLSMWKLWLLLLIIAVVVLFLEKEKRDKRYKSINEVHSDRQILNKLRGLKPKEFEDYIAYLFSQLGFATEIVGGSYDGGVDVIATKDGIKHYIQCKKFITSQVSVGSVRDFYGSLVDHIANGKGYFITTNKFTLEAERFAKDKPIELIDGYGLLKYIEMAKMDTEAYFNKEEICPDCGSKLIQRNGKYGKFWGCSKYPECKFTKK